MNKSYVAISSSDEQIYSLAINLIKCLLNSKYKDKDYGVDFIGYFYSSQNFIDEILDEANIRIINGINELISCVKTGCLNVQMPNLNILQNLENNLKDYLMYSMITCYNKDSLCDCYINCEKQKQMYINYGLIRTYLILCKIINKSFNENDNKKNNNKDIEKIKQIIVSNIFNDLLKQLKKYNIILPVKIFLYKNYILQSIIIILHMIVKLFYKDILTMNNDKSIFYSDISFIKDLTESINSYFFLLGNDILYYLKFPLKNNNDNNNELSSPVVMPYLRIIDESNPINYYNISQVKILNPTFRIFHQNSINISPSLNTPNLNNNINKENINIIGNSSLSNFSKNLENNISSVLFSKHNNNNISINENNNNFNKNGFGFFPTNTFQSNIFSSEIKIKIPIISEYLYRYDITSIINNFKKEQLFSLPKIGFEYKFENNHHYIYSNNEDNNNNLSQIIYLGKKDVSSFSLNNSSIYNLLKNEPFSSQIIEQLYVNLLDGFDESNKGKNSENSLKYYDISFNMDYFSFVEKCKEFIL